MKKGVEVNSLFVLHILFIKKSSNTTKSFWKCQRNSLVSLVAETTAEIQLHRELCVCVRITLIQSQKHLSPVIFNPTRPSFISSVADIEHSLLI